MDNQRLAHLLVTEIRRAECNVLRAIAIAKGQILMGEGQIDQDIDAANASVAANTVAIQGEETEISAVQAEIAELEAKAAGGTLSGDEHQRLADLKAALDAQGAQITADTATLTTAAGVDTPAPPADGSPADPADPSDGTPSA